MENPRAVKIDRLLLNLPGGSPAQARRLAERVAAGLADAWPDAAGALPQAGDLPSVKINVVESLSRDPDILARLIVAETLRSLARSG